MAELAPLTLTVEPQINEAAFARLRSIGGERSPREVALDFAMSSFDRNETPPSDTAIVARATTFLAFLDPA